MHVADSTQSNLFAYRSPFGPLVPETRTEPKVMRDRIAKWLSTWSSEDLSKIQLEVMSVRVIQDHKLKGEKPILDEIDQANYSVKALLYQRNDLEVIDRIVYCKFIDRNRNIVFQLVTPDATRDLMSWATIFDISHQSLPGFTPFAMQWPHHYLTTAVFNLYKEG